MKNSATNCPQTISKYDQKRQRNTTADNLNLNIMFNQIYSYKILTDQLHVNHKFFMNM